MGAPEVIVTACWEMNCRILIISPFAESSRLPGVRPHKGRVLQIPSSGKEARAPDVVTFVSDASEDRFSADHVQRWHLRTERKLLP